MKEITLREANQQFSKLVREVEATGEAVMVLRNGKQAVRIVPAVQEPPGGTLTGEMEEALAFLNDPKNHFKSPPGWRFDKEELYEAALLRHKAVRQLWGAGSGPKKRRRG